MKMQPVNAIHRCYEGEPGSKENIFYLSDGKVCKRLGESKFLKFIDGIPTGHALRVTQANSTDAILLTLVDRGIDVQYTHWHSTGIPKNLDPEEIANRFANLPTDVFRKFSPRKDIAKLREQVMQRAAIMEHRKGDMLRLSALKKTLAVNDETPLVDELEGLKVIEDEINSDKRRFETPIDKKITKMAREIQECKDFNRVAGISDDSYISAATIVAYLGDMSRFPKVSSLWHYAGQHVVDGHAPKRERGKPGDWQPKIRTALYLLGTSIIKNRSNRWRPVYEQFLEQELLVHDIKHPNCKTKQGHCGARARRRVVKEILVEFYTLVSEQKLEPRPFQS